MKVILVRPNYESHIITPPLGLGYLSSYLKQHGIRVTIIDALRDNIDNDTVLRRVLVENPEVVGITCLTAFYNEVVDLSGKLKSAGVKTIIGGVHPTFLPGQTLRETHCDYVIAGEGERALCALLLNGLCGKSIRGVYALNDIDESATRVEQADIVENLDDLPFPDWEQLDPNSYPVAPHGAVVKRVPVGVVMTTRGCPHKCAFCASPRFYRRKVRYRTARNIIEEIAHLTDRYNVREIHFEDDNLTLRRDHVTELCNGLIEAGIRVPWSCPNGIRADSVDEPLLRLMKTAGCYHVAFGVESANPEILSKVGKNEEIETIEAAIASAARVGLSCQGFFVFGLPGETPETIEESISFARRSRLSRAQFLVLDVLPGSELWYRLKGQFTPDWGKKSYKEPEWIPENVTKEELMQSQSRAFREFYLRSPARLFRLVMSMRVRQWRFLWHRLRDYGLTGKSKARSKERGGRMRGSRACSRA